MSCVIMNTHLTDVSILCSFWELAYLKLFIITLKAQYDLDCVESAIKSELNNRVIIKSGTCIVVVKTEILIPTWNRWVSE